MKKFIVVIVFCFCFMGCSINQQFVETCQDTWGKIGPRYIEYTKNDPDLDDDIKEIRLRTANQFTEMLEEADK